MTTSDTAYKEFLESKRITAPSVGRQVDDADINPMLFPFQRDLVKWSLRKGRAAIFANTGLGKTAMQLAFAQLTDEPTIIFAPLGVTQQTIEEGRKFGIDVTYVRDQLEVKSRIVISNYEMLDHFDPSAFGSVILDESSILKSLTGVTRAKLTEMFSDTHYRLCCTATPAPNDIAEIANHAEFLGVMSRTEMLATWFVHDDEGWRLKGHAKEAFYRWLASWGMFVRRPSDLGYSDGDFVLPPLHIEPVIVDTDYRPSDRLFFTGLKGITDRARVRRETLPAKLDACLAKINAEPDKKWIIWCGLNVEQYAIVRLLGKRCISVGGSTPREEKLRLEREWRLGDVPVMVTKASVFGHGLNWQHCSRMISLGLSDSWEEWFQKIRRSWRFGQRDEVYVYPVIAEVETEVYENVQRKEKEAEEMAEHLVVHVAEFERSEIGRGRADEFVYQIDQTSGDNWTLMLGDSVERLRELNPDSIDLSVHSPPFAQLYVYSASERDLGNSATVEEFFEHYRYIIREMLRVTKPGRLACVHCAEIPAMLVRDGYIGMKDFPGQVIEAYEAEGWIFHDRITIWKNPQPQAIRTHAKGLAFPQLRKDASWMRTALADYICVFRKPGDNAVPIEPGIDNEAWIEWASPVWFGIRESETLNAAEARTEEDERHICPLQLGTIERCIRLWSNRGETILSPCAGIGSEGYQAIRFGRKFVGCELKPEYYRTAIKNLQRAEHESRQVDLFTLSGVAI
ncbi:MAG: helicase [Patescibacteria group bacterium]|nr:helicase [Patescibacteria group bacterium]